MGGIGQVKSTAACRGTVGIGVGWVGKRRSAQGRLGLARGAWIISFHAIR